MDIGGADEGAIGEMLASSEGLYIVKEQAIYRVQLADDIDPERSNPAIPNVQQKVYSLGYASPLVGRTILTIKTLVNEQNFGKHTSKKALSVAFNILDNLLALKDIYAKLVADEDHAEAERTARRLKDGSLAIPSIGDVSGRAKTFIQTAEHCAQDLYRICRLFYETPPGAKSGWFDGIVKRVREKHPGRAEFTDYLAQVAGYCKFLRNARHCVEHPKSEQRIRTSDFKLSKAAELHGPAIEVIHAETPEPEVPLRVYMEHQITTLTDITETMVAYICAAEAKMGGFSLDVAERPEGQRQKEHQHVRFTYCVELNGQWLPLG